MLRQIKNVIIVTELLIICLVDYFSIYYETFKCFSVNILLYYALLGAGFSVHVSH